jgi:hypothetical protein
MDRTWDDKPIAREPPFACCVVVWREAAGDREFLLLHRLAPGGVDFAGDWAWTPPAGARQPGEPPDTAAARELQDLSSVVESVILTGRDTSRRRLTSAPDRREAAHAIRLVSSRGSAASSQRCVCRHCPGGPRGHPSVDLERCWTSTSAYRSFRCSGSFRGNVEGVVTT